MLYIVNLSLVPGLQLVASSVIINAFLLHSVFHTKWYEFLGKKTVDIQG